MSLETRIERLECSAHGAGAVHVVYVPQLADAAGQMEAQRLALERNPPPRGAKLTVCLIDYARVGTGDHEP